MNQLENVRRSRTSSDNIYSKTVPSKYRFTYLFHQDMTDTKGITGMLSGLSVLDLADSKGSFCSKLLADLGARVIKIEKPCNSLPLSQASLSVNQPQPGGIYQFLYHNSNKLGITLNIEIPEGRLLFLKLIRKNNIIIETFPVGYLKKNELDFNSLKKDNPNLIMASISGFGQDGPRKDYVSSDIVSSAFGGHMSVSGSKSMGPRSPGAPDSVHTRHRM